MQIFKPWLMFNIWWSWVQYLSQLSNFIWNMFAPSEIPGNFSSLDLQKDSLDPKIKLLKNMVYESYFHVQPFFPCHHKSRSKLKTCSVHQRSLINILFQPTITCCLLLLMELITHWLFLIKCHWRYDLELSVDGIAACPPPAPIVAWYAMLIYLKYNELHPTPLTMLHMSVHTICCPDKPNAHCLPRCIWNNWRICFHPTTNLTGRMVLILELRLPYMCHVSSKIASLNC